VHQGWLNEDHSVFVQNDEGDERTGGASNTRTTVWDVADLDDPVWLTDYQAAGTDIDANLYLSGDFVYQANYTAGLRILDLSDPANPVEAGFFDTYQPVAGTPGYDIWGGAWTSYPYLRSGAVAISSYQEGLVLVLPMLSTGTDAERGHPTVRPSELSVYPNPFADRITASLRLDRTEDVDIGVFDVLGRQLLPIQSVRLEADTPHTLEVGLIDLPPGVYFFTVRGRTVVLSAPIIRAE